MNPTESWRPTATPSPTAGAVTPPAPDESALQRAVEEYLALVEQGRGPDRQQFLARFAGVAGVLGECLDALDFLRSAAPGLSRPAAPADPAAGQEVHAEASLGDFRIVREIGRGGMGVVYEARQLSLGRRVALKVLPFAAALDPKQLQRFKNEAQAAACLHHTNIVPVHYVGCVRGVHFFAMQFIDGHNLAEFVLRSRHQAGNEGAAGRLESPEDPGASAPTAGYSPPRSAAQDTTACAALPTEGQRRGRDYFRTVSQLGVQAAEALEHAHQMGIVHRDIKPANLMLDGQGRLWVTDFGLAQFDLDAHLTLTGDLMGTLRYMSPEQAVGRRLGVDHRTDVYGLGVTLYELLTLRPAFPGGDRQEVLRRVISEEPPAPRRVAKDVPVDLETVVLKAMAKDPQDRYATARELADDLARYGRDEPVRARRTPLLQRARRWARRHRGWVWAAAAVLVTAAAVAFASLAASNVRITRERDLAREQRLLARKAVDEMYTEVAEELLVNTPGKEELRRRFLLKALAFYEEFAGEEGSEPELRFAAAWAYKRVARLHHFLADKDKAEENYRKGASLAERLVADSPDNADYRHLLALICFEHSFVLEARQKLPEALAERQRSLDIYERLAQEHPGVGEYQRARAHVCGRMGLLYWGLRRPQEAVQVQRRGLALARRLVADFPKELNFRSDLAICCADLGTSLCRTGPRAEAKETLKEAVGAWEELSAREPWNVDTKFHLASTLVFLGGVSSRQDGEAFGIYRRSVSLFRDLALEFPERTHFQQSLLNCLVALMHAAPHSYDHFQLSEVAEEVLRPRGTPLVVRLKAASILAQCYRTGQNDRLLSAEEREASVTPYIARIRQVLNSAEADPSFSMQMAYSSDYNDAWPCLPERGISARFSFREQATRAHPESTVHWHLLGSYYYFEGRFKDALEALTKSMSLRDGGNGYNFLYVAMVRWKLGDKAQARQWYDKAVAQMGKGIPQDSHLTGIRIRVERLFNEKPPPTPRNDLIDDLSNLMRLLSETNRSDKKTSPTPSQDPKPRKE